MLSSLESPRASTIDFLILPDLVPSWPGFWRADSAAWAIPQAREVGQRGSWSPTGLPSSHDSREAWALSRNREPGLPAIPAGSGPARSANLPDPLAIHQACDSGRQVALPSCGSTLAPCAAAL